MMKDVNDCGFCTHRRGRKVRLLSAHVNTREKYGISFCVTVSERFKTASVYVGAIVGAGFATGREIILFFGDGGWLAPLLTGVAMGACASLFLCIGKAFAGFVKNEKADGRLFRGAKATFIALIELCMLLTMTTMIGGLQSLFADTRAGKIAGFALAVLCVALSSAGAKAVGRINIALVPLLFALLAVLYFKSSAAVQALPLNWLSCVRYLSMNMLLGGCLAVKDGERASAADIVFIGTVCAAALGVMTFFVYCAACDYPRSEMPVYSLCAANGLGFLGAVVVGIAIITTLAGAAKSLGDGLRAVLPSPKSVTAVLLLLTLASYGWDFSAAVDLFYPFIAAVASGVFAVAFAACALYLIKKRAVAKRRKKNYFKTVSDKQVKAPLQSPIGAPQNRTDAPPT